MQLTLLSTVSYRGEEVTAPRLRGLPALPAGELRSGCSTGRIVEGLWPDERPANPVKAVQILVSRTRARLGAAAEQARAGVTPAHSPRPRPDSRCGRAVLRGRTRGRLWGLRRDRMWGRRRSAIRSRRCGANGPVPTGRWRGSGHSGSHVPGATRRPWPGSARRRGSYRGTRSCCSNSSGARPPPPVRPPPSPRTTAIGAGCATNTAGPEDGGVPRRRRRGPRPSGCRRCPAGRSWRRARPGPASAWLQGGFREGVAVAAPETGGVDAQKRRARRCPHLLPLTTYTAQGGLRQGPRRAAESHSSAPDLQK